MGDPKAFLNIPRHEAGYRPVHERITDFSEVEQTLNTSDRKLQASRCMDCGVPFCHWACPLGNKQPEWQDALYKGKWREAYQILSATCDFPEFTGRICPALCEKSCVLKLSCDAPVTIRENEAAIVEAAFREGYIMPAIPKRNGKRVAVIGSGPAGYTAAERAGANGLKAVLFEKKAIGGVCLNEGCIPTKTLLYSAKILDSIKNASKYGVFAESPSFDLSKIMSRKNKTVKMLTGGVKMTVNSYGVTIVEKEAFVEGEENGLIRIVCDGEAYFVKYLLCLLYTSPSPRD